MLNQNQIKDLYFATVADAKAAGRPNEVCYVAETGLMYYYLAAGAAYTADDIGVLTTANGGNTRWVSLRHRISDYLVIPVGAGKDSTIAAPDALAVFQGTVGNTINPTAANVSYGTFTINGNGFDITSAVYGSGTQTGTFTIAGLTIGSIYRLQFTPTVAGQVPTFTATSGIGDVSIPTIVTATVENIYFEATDTTAVFTATNTGASTWSTTSTTCKLYSRPAYLREFSATATQILLYNVPLPADWNGGTITITPYAAVSQATAPANGETVIWSFSAFAIPNSGSKSRALGTAVTSTWTADATLVQYDQVIGTETAAITIAGAAAGGGQVCEIKCKRVTTDTYEQKIGLESLLLKFTRSLAA
jgi:hypothetical protein